MTISNELLDELLKGCKRPEDLLGDAGLMKELKVRLMERMLGAELTAHLGYEAGAEPPAEQANRRNGVATKRVKGSDGEVPLSVPRDRDGSFEPEPDGKVFSGSHLDAVGTRRVTVVYDAKDTQRVAMIARSKGVKPSSVYRDALDYYLAAQA